MPKLSFLLKRVCGIPTARHHNGKLLPQSVHGCLPVVVMHDRRLSAGIFEVRSYRQSKAKVYRLAVWRTYQLRSGTERATMQLHRDELDPALALLAKCGDRMSMS
jgi:hypothetical protein